MRNDLFLIAMGKRISKARKLQGISLRDMSKLSGLDISNLSRLECGQKDSHILTIKMIADLLKVDIKDFL